MKKPVCLIIMDGFGLRSDLFGNALTPKLTPKIARLMQKHPCTSLLASGAAVGLPEGQMGNSEVGHMNIGAGRIVESAQTRISQAINSEDFFKNEVLLEAICSCKVQNSSLHLVGLISDGGVHSCMNHLYALIDLARRFKLDKVYIHGILDGRDTSPTSGATYLKKLQDYLASDKVGRIVSLVGRYYAMDRDNNWERTQVAYDSIVEGEGTHSDDLVAALKALYTSGVTDEFVKPLVSKPVPFCTNDSIIFFNFRADRMRQFVSALISQEFTQFARKRRISNLNATSMTKYGKRNGLKVAFSDVLIKNSLGEQISKAGMNQLRIAETEKYAHVSFFFNCGREEAFWGEDRILLPSPRVATYDQSPQMSAFKITKEVCSKLEEASYDFIAVNLANCDMVGHTGNFAAACLAAKTVDDCVGEIVAKVKEASGVAIVTADHGNAEQMVDSYGGPFTAHTTNPVPFMLIGAGGRLNEGGRLCDIAPTVLEIMGIEKPEQMTGESLVVPNE